MRLAVVTWVPDPEGPEGRGNLAAVIGELFVDETGGRIAAQAPIVRLEHMRGLSTQQAIGFVLSLRHEVFHIGEILVLDDDGREIGWPQRKPEKWHVRTQRFGIHEIEAAIALASQLTNDAMLSPTQPESEG